MTTVTMNISLTEDLKSFVDARIKALSYSSTSEYVRELMRKDENLSKEERFKGLIQAGLDSGSGRPWEEHKTDLLARIEGHRVAARKAT